MILRTGVDLVHIHRLVELPEGIKSRFIDRILTGSEKGKSHTPSSICGIFAAKEAVVKALGCGIGTVGWQDIEIKANDEGTPEVSLYGPAAARAREIGLTTWSVSISHSGDLAVAYTCAIGEK
jgi:holo-[acyl-carrier protein] synthase